MAVVKKTKPIDYSKPLENKKHERFCQEYVVQLNATNSYKTAYTTCSAKTAKINGCKLLTHTNIVGRIAHLQAKLSDASGVDAKMLMDELKKIGFSNTQAVHNVFGQAKRRASLPPEIAAAVESVNHTKNGIKYTMHDKLGAIEKMAKRIGFYEEHNKQLTDPVAELIKAIGASGDKLPIKT